MRKLIKRESVAALRAKKIDELQKSNASASKAKLDLSNLKADTKQLHDEFQQVKVLLHEFRKGADKEKLNLNRQLEKQRKDVESYIAQSNEQKRIMDEVLLDLKNRIEVSKQTLKDSQTRQWEAAGALELVLKKLDQARAELVQVQTETEATKKELAAVKGNLEKIDKEYTDKAVEMEAYSHRKHDLDIYANRIQKFYNEAGLGHIKI